MAYVRRRRKSVFSGAVLSKRSFELSFFRINARRIGRPMLCTFPGGLSRREMCNVLLVERLQLDGLPHGFGADGGWIAAYDEWLTRIFGNN